MCAPSQFYFVTHAPSSASYHDMSMWVSIPSLFQRAGAVFPQRSESSAPVFTPPQTQPLSSYPPNLRNPDHNQQDGAETSAESEFPTLRCTNFFYPHFHHHSILVHFMNVFNMKLWNWFRFHLFSLTEIQNARGIMDVLSEMLNALEPGNKEVLY